MKPLLGFLTLAAVVKLLLGLVTVGAAVAFLYFWMISLRLLDRARHELNPDPPLKPSWLPAVLNSESYTSLGQELLGQCFEAFILGIASAIVMLACGLMYSS